MIFDKQKINDEEDLLQNKLILLHQKYIPRNEYDVLIIPIPAKSKLVRYI